MNLCSNVTFKCKFIAFLKFIKLSKQIKMFNLSFISNKIYNRAHLIFFSLFRSFVRAANIASSKTFFNPFYCNLKIKFYF